MKSVEDRRVRRTRSALSAALVELVLEKGFHAVTVEQITERADVGRATFYAHYRDKEDLLLGVVRELALDRLPVAPGETADQDGPSGLPLLRLFQHAERQRAAFQVILRGEGDGRALRAFADLLGGAAEAVLRQRSGAAGGEPRVPPDLAARAWTGEVIGVLAWWIEGGSAYSAVEVARYLGECSAFGRRWAGGGAQVVPEQSSPRVPGGT
ncbi:TetR/AcrR family transcriptional regulator [Kitasatospora sp. NPDC088134]|uniref:TetR/AcrR family transcriptional regulator n=1 Tax=Kitasatospora sp. NPDC088134 TaxID=3364071 RepID=UPI00382C650B